MAAAAEHQPYINISESGVAQKKSSAKKAASISVNQK